MVLRFMGNLIGVKANQAVTAGVEALIRWDPKSATEAELRTMEQHLDELGTQVAQARQSYDREQKEADAIMAGEKPGHAGGHAGKNGAGRGA